MGKPQASEAAEVGSEACPFTSRAGLSTPCNLTEAYGIYPLELPWRMSELMYVNAGITPLWRLRIMYKILMNYRKTVRTNNNIPDQN